MADGPRLVIGIDPGLTTGLCIAEIHDPFDTEAITPILCADIAYEDRFAQINSLFISGAPFITPNELSRVTQVVCEGFRLYPHRAQAQIGSEFPSVRVIGVLETILYFTYPVLFESLVFLTAAEHKGTKIYSELPASTHQRDAYSLCRYWTIKRGYRKHG